MFRFSGKKVYPLVGWGFTGDNPVKEGLITTNPVICDRSKTVPNIPINELDDSTAAPPVFLIGTISSTVQFRSRCNH